MSRRQYLRSQPIPWRPEPCRSCGRPFRNTHPRAAYCGRRACQQARHGATQRRYRERREPEPDLSPREIARRIAAWQAYFRRVPQPVEDAVYYPWASSLGSL